MSKRFIEVREDGAIEGVIALAENGYAEVHFEWLQSLLEESGRDWTIHQRGQTDEWVVTEESA